MNQNQKMKASMSARGTPQTWPLSESTSAKRRLPESRDPKTVESGSLVERGLVCI